MQPVFTTILEAKPTFDKQNLNIYGYIFSALSDTNRFYDNTFFPLDGKVMAHRNNGIA